MARLIALFFCLACGCGIEVVELAPEASGDVLIVGEVPRAALARFANEPAGMMDPMLGVRYPEPGTVLPRDVAPVAFSWGPGPKQQRIFELTLQGARTLRVYTSEPTLSVPAERWRTLLEGDALVVTLRSLENGGKRELRRGEPRTIAIRAPLAGTLYLATASGAERATLASEASAEAELALADPALRAGRLARVTRSAIELVDRASGSVEDTLRAPSGARFAHPSWSVDGASILVSYWAPELGLADDPSDEHDGSQLARLTLAGELSLFALDGEARMNPRRPREGSDGLLFEANDTLFVARSDGSMARRVACDGPMTKARAPAWLANGWIAFVSTRKYLDAEPRAQVWLSELQLTEPLRCSPPLWLPAQSPAHDYVTITFD